MNIKKLTTILLCGTIPLFVAASCNNSGREGVDENASLEEQVDLLIEQNEYETALEMLQGEDGGNEEIRFLLEKTHLNYGLYSMNTFDETEMRTRMNRALRQFTEVLRINPDNGIAREQIEQIMMIYGTIPDREPEADVLEGLRDVGYDY